MSKIYYNQTDSRWANHPYPSPTLPNATIGSGGCGVACGAMVVSSFRETIFPDTMGDIAMTNGFRVVGGTSDNLYPYIAERWGLEYKRVGTSFEAHQACKEGWFVVIACGAGLWTTGGHFILAVGANDSEIEIFDPYLYNGKFDSGDRRGKVRLEGVSAWVEINTFKASSNAQRFFAFKLEGGEPPAPQPTPDVKTAYINTQSLPLNVRSTPNGTVVGTLPKGTKVTVYGLSGTWANIGTNRWVSNEYLRYEGAPAPTPSFQPWNGVVTANGGLNVRSGAGTNYPRVSGVSKGATVTILEESNGWGRISSGWVTLQYISKTGGGSAPSFQPYTATVTARTGLNVRAGCGTSYRLVGALRTGEKVTVYEEKSGWARIGDGKWVTLEYLKK